MKEGNSRRQLERAVNVQPCHVLMRHHRQFPSTAEIHKEPGGDSRAEQRRGGGAADIQSRTAERRKHSYSEPVYSFRWMTLLSVCLVISFSLCLAHFLRPRQSRNQLTSAQKQWPLTSSVFLNLNKKRKTKLPERNNDGNGKGVSCLETVCKSTQCSIPALSLMVHS